MRENRVLRFALALTGCRVREDPGETYETRQPWVTYTYRYTDRALTLFGRSLIGMTCCICGRREDALIKGPRRGPIEDKGHHPERRRFLKEHEHPGVNRNPMSWDLPLRNMAALRTGDLEDVLGVAINRAVRPSTEKEGQGQ